MITQDLAIRMRELLKAIIENGPPEGEYDGQMLNMCCGSVSDHKPSCWFLKAEALVKEANV